MFRKIKEIHFVGIGGSGMSGIAEILLSSGYKVRGSDIQHSATVKRLEEMGATIFIGHNPENILGSEVVVASSAISPDNPEIIAARYRNIPIIPRAEMLAELMRMKYSVAVAGAHGKTTTTSMLAQILIDTDLDPTVIIGGRLNKFDSNAKLGKGELMVAEADESDGSFMKLSPTICIVTNLDEEHLDYYQDGMEQIERTFLAFMNKVPFYGLAIVCKDDPRLESLINRISRKVVTYGLNGYADLSAANIRQNGFSMTYELMVRGSNLGQIELNVAGTHNVQNSLAAIAVGLEFDVSIDSIRESLKRFTGADRRFSHLGNARERLFIDDYAHHPTEILFTLKTAQDVNQHRVVAVFQPHRYSRFQHCWDQFLNCFQLADHLIVLPVYPAGEKPIPQVNSQQFFEQIQKSHPNVSYLDDFHQLGDHLLEVSQPGDMILSLGAGSISGTLSELCQSWQKEDLSRLKQKRKES